MAEAHVPLKLVKRDYKDFQPVIPSRGQAILRPGEFVLPYSYDRYNFKSDADFAEITTTKGRCSILFSSLSRDDAPDAKEFQGSESIFTNGDPVVPSGKLVWFHISTLKSKAAEQVKSFYEHEPTYDEFAGNLATSFIFGDKPAFYCHGKKARYHFTLDDILAEYKSMVGEDVEFRCYGTTRYKMEVMYTVLVCPANSTHLDGTFPVMQAGADYDVIKITRSKSGRYQGIWRPLCTRDGYYLMWDQVTFAFYLPDTGVQQLKIPDQYSMQLLQGKKFGTPDPDKCPNDDAVNDENDEGLTEMMKAISIN